MSKKYTGVYPVSITPFKENGDFDFDAAKKHLDYLIEAGVHGLCVWGATGEYQSITLAEHKAYVREVVPYIGSRVPVIVGCTREMPDEAADLARNAFECGASAAMILPTYYCHPTQAEIYEYYRYISEQVKGGEIMVYNNPGSSGVDIEKETYKRLLELEPICAIKESTGNIRRLTEVVNDADGQVSVFCGWDNMAYESFRCGAVGWISMLANLAPKQCAALFEAVYIEHNDEKARRIYSEILPGLTALETTEKPVQVIKYVLELQGHAGGYCRRPRISLTEAEKQEIRGLFDLKVLY